MAKILESSKQNIEMLAAFIKSGGIVAFATETVWGLGASIYNTAAVSRLYEIKKRPLDNPLIVHVASIEDIDNVAVNIRDYAKVLLNNYAPGPITVVLQRASNVPSIVSAGLSTIAVRIPAIKSIRDMIRLSGVPICAPSANKSTRPSPTSVAHVLEDLNDEIEYILDSSEGASIGIESTIVDCTKKTPLILREGYITKDDIEKTLQTKVKVYKHNSLVAIAPGTKYKHYAPSVPLVYVVYNDNIVSAVLKEYDKAKVDGNPVIICTDENRPRYGDCNTFSMGRDTKEYAKNLYNAFRYLEKIYTTIIAEGIEKVGIGCAVDNKLIKAASDIIFKAPKNNTKALFCDKDKNATTNISKSKLKNKQANLDGNLFKPLPITLKQYSIMFVCTGNTCRSPMMEHLFRDFVKYKDGYDVVVESSGINANPYDTITDNARQVLENMGIQFNGKHSKQFVMRYIDDYDLIVTMTQSHKRLLPISDKVVSMLDVCGKDVMDPYGKSIGEYLEVAEYLKYACQEIWDKLVVK